MNFLKNEIVFNARTLLSCPFDSGLILAHSAHVASHLDWAARQSHSSQAKLLSGLHFLRMDGQMCSLCREEVSCGADFLHPLLWASARLMAPLTHQVPWCPQMNLPFRESGQS